MVPTFNTSSYIAGQGAELACPGCGSNMLHQDRVEVFERGEDDKLGVHVVVEGLRAIIDTDLKGNPSARRDGLAIRFWCESCDARPVLTIAQHKGSTLVEFSE